MHPGTPLTDAVRLWPTPDAQVMNETQTLEAREARKARELVKGYNGNGGGEPPGFAVKRWATPVRADGERSSLGMFHGREGNPTLLGQVQMWATPKGTAGGNVSRGNERSGELLLEGQAQMWATPQARDWSGPHGTPGPRDLPTLSAGAERFNRARLNPLFVEWLMGFPIGWTDSAPLGTEWSRWWRLMRSELSRLASPC